MQYINDGKVARIKELRDKSEAYIFIKQKIPMKDWVVLTGHYKGRWEGMSSIYINGLNEDEIREIKTYGFYEDLPDRDDM